MPISPNGSKEQSTPHGSPAVPETLRGLAIDPTCNVPIHKLRVIYFFSKTRNIRQFLETLMVEFTLLKNEGQVLAGGRSLLLREYDIYKESAITAGKRAKKILLYAQKRRLVHLEVRY